MSMDGVFLFEMTEGVLHKTFDVKSPVDKFFKAFLEISKFPIEDNAVVIMEDENLEERTVKTRISSIEISKCYKKLEGIITVTPKNKGGGHVTWTVEYEKTNAKIEDPDSIIETSIKYFQGIDDILTKETEEKFVKEMSFLTKEMSGENFQRLLGKKHEN